MLSSVSHFKSVDAKERSDAIAISVTFVVLCLLLSAPFWYLRAQLPPKSNGMLLSFANMWCPAAAAILARLIHRRGLKGFGFTLGKARWLVLAVLLPAVAGLVMFGSAWLFHIAPFDDAKIHKLLSPSFIPIFFGVFGDLHLRRIGRRVGLARLARP